MKTRSEKQKQTRVAFTPKFGQSSPKRSTTKSLKVSKQKMRQQTPYSDTTVHENGQLLMGIKKRVIVKNRKQHFTYNYKIITFQIRNANGNSKVSHKFMCYSEKDLGMEKYSELLKNQRCDNDMDTDSEEIENATNSILSQLKQCVKDEKFKDTILQTRTP